MSLFLLCVPVLQLAQNSTRFVGSWFGYVMCVANLDVIWQLPARRGKAYEYALFIFLLIFFFFFFWLHFLWN